MLTTFWNRKLVHYGTKWCKIICIERELARDCIIFNYLTWNNLTCEFASSPMVGYSCLCRFSFAVAFYILNRWNIVCSHPVKLSWLILCECIVWLLLLRLSASNLCCCSRWSWIVENLIQHLVCVSNHVCWRAKIFMYCIWRPIVSMS